MTVFLGLDVSGFPGLDTMQWLRANTGLVWCSFYLPAPSHRDPAWLTNRAALVRQGWGLAPIYVGQQVTGPGSHRTIAAQGGLDGADAADRMRTAGFPLGSWCYLDLENGPPLQTVQKDYVSAWVGALVTAGFSPGIYCSYLLGSEIHTLCPAARIWVFHVRTTKSHPVDSLVAPKMAESGYAEAFIWQYDDSAVLSIPSGTIEVDLDIALTTDPSAPGATTPMSTSTSTVPTATSIIIPPSPGVSAETHGIAVGDLAQSLLQGVEVVIPALFQLGESVAPFPLNMILSAGATSLEGYVHGQIVANQGLIAGATIPVSTTNSLVAAAISLWNSQEPVLAAPFTALVGDLEAWTASRVQALLSTKGVTVAPTNPTSITKS